MAGSWRRATAVARRGEEERRSGGILEGTKGQQVLCHRARVDPARSSGALLADCESRGPGHPPRACFCTSDVIEIWLGPPFLVSVGYHGRAVRVERRRAAMRLPKGAEARTGKRGVAYHDARRGEPEFVRLVTGVCANSRRAYGPEKTGGGTFLFPGDIYLGARGRGLLVLHKSGVCLCASRGTVI